MIASTAYSIATAAPRSSGEPVPNGTDSATSGGFAALMGDDRAAASQAPAAQRPSGEPVRQHPDATGKAGGKTGGKTGGKNLPDEGAAADPASPVAADEDEQPADVVADPAGDSEIFALMLAANLPATPRTATADGAATAEPAEALSKAGSGVARAAATAASILPAQAAPAAAGQGMQGPATDAGTPIAAGAAARANPAGTPTDPAALPLPTPATAQVAAPAVKLGAIEIVPASTPLTTKPAAGTPILAPDQTVQASATVAAAQADEPAPASPGAGRAKASPATATRASLIGERAAALARADEAATTPLRTASADQPTLPHAAWSQAPVLRTEAAGGTQPGAAPDGPQDFATLVQRIAEAREAVNAQSIRTSLSHSEFGHVSLHFRPGDAGMNVTLASADPDFARSVQAAAAAASMQGGGEQPREAPFGQNPHNAHNPSSAMSGGQAGNQNQQSRPESAGSLSQRGVSNSRSNSDAGEASLAARPGDRRGSGIYA